MKLRVTIDEKSQNFMTGVIRHSEGYYWVKDVIQSGLGKIQEPHTLEVLIHLQQKLWLSLKKKKKSYFYLKDSCFTVLCWFLLYISKNQPWYSYVPLLLTLPPTFHLTLWPSNVQLYLVTSHLGHQVCDGKFLCQFEWAIEYPEI